MLRQNFILTILLISTFSANLTAQEVTIYEKYADFEHLLQKNNDTTYVINFWATWCKPCIKELPEFEEINQHFKNKKFKMILVSLDFDSQLDSKVKPFINNQNIQSEVVLLADTKQNDWIDKVNPEWSGSIPVTVIYNNDFYFFKEGSMSYDELNELITKNIKQ
jgi:thiol-disulfide isomerase/thioredoxin